MLSFSVYVKSWIRKVAKMFLYIFIALVGGCIWWVQKRFKFWEERGFYSPPSSFPFGSLKGVGSETTTFELNDKIYKMYKGKAVAVGMYFFLKPVILPMDLELLKNIFIRDFSNFHDRGFYYNKEDDPTSAKYEINQLIEFEL